MYEIYGGLMQEEICVIIDGKRVLCPPESSILEAAKMAGIEIPTLCYLKGLTPTGACGVCAVEIIEDGERVIRRACRYKAKDGMVVYTNTPAVQAYRENRITELTEDVLSKMSDEEFSERAFAWRGRKTVLRNLEILKK